METIRPYTPRGHEDRNQRWARRERADLFARDGNLHAQSVSQRQAAQVLDVPRSTLQAWRAYQDRLDACPAVVAFFQSPPGLAFLHRLVLAFHVVCVEGGACGMRLVCLLIQITGLNRFVGAASGTQQQVNRHVEEAIVMYRQQASGRLTHEMPSKDITLTQDETFPGGLSLVGIESVSNSMLLEQATQARDGTWHALMEQALAGLTGWGRQSTGDEAPGLLADVAYPLGAHHSPEVCHVPHALSQAVSDPIATTQRAAPKVAEKAEAKRKEMPESLHDTNDEPALRGPGRPPKETASLEQVEQEMEVARHEHQRLAGQREKVTQSLRAIGHAYHCVDVERGVRRNGKRMAGDIHEPIATIRSLAQQAGLSETCLDRIETAERGVPQRQATIEFVSRVVF